ncbi:T9SS type A sorting domain-containing protein [Labilibacter marinus]|uniref:T9SS type A sorting domain-containing protein n=1 Tax=Labilibacter marinus TaxID=1477105 RepID=UPI0009501C9A|nr:T9SS type A sorting domain-containing protein [Labilibacter marinus]
MKKIYTLIAIALMSISTFAQTITVGTKTLDNNGFIWALTAAAGSSLTIEGSGFAEGDVVSGNLTNWVGWNAGPTVYGSYSATADASGNISGDLDIDGATPPGPSHVVNPGGYMIQLNINAPTKDNFYNGFNYANLKIEITVSTDIDSPELSAGSVYVIGKKLCINDATAANYKVYNLSGTIVQTGSIDGSSVQIPLTLAKGIYIVKVGDTTTKISL